MTGKNFFDFMLDAQKDWNLLKAFLSAKDKESLMAALRGYDIAKEDIEKLLRLKGDKWGVSITETPLQY